MNNIKYVIQKVKSENRFLYFTVLIDLIFAFVCLVGLNVDDRMLLGVNVWIKPLKFAISTGIYVMTVGFLNSLYPYSKRKKNIINYTVAFTLFVEMCIIMYQAFKGVKSHFNFDTEIDALLFLIMGIFIGINVIIMVLYIIDTMRLKMKTEKSIQWAIFLGWAVVLFGSWVGGQMLSQVGHNIGVADGGPGLPLLNWSTIAGDLRVAHFFGLHGIQILPLFAYIISKKWKTSQRNQILGVTLFSLFFIGWVGFTFYQAKQGIALLSL